MDTTKTHNGHHNEHHVGNTTYILVFVTLLILTFVTYWTATRMDLGVFNIVLALVIASIKGGIVALYFMHLKFEDSITWVFVIYPIVLIVLLIGLVASDVFYRGYPLL